MEETLTPPLALTKRLDAIVLRAVVTVFNAEGQRVGEVMTEDLKLFRASTPDVWAALDKAVRVE